MRPSSDMDAPRVEGWSSGPRPRALRDETLYAPRSPRGRIFPPHCRQGRMTPKDSSQAGLIDQVLARRLTYLHPEALAELAGAVEDIEARHVEGDILELGCALGGSTVVIAHAKGSNRRF